LTGIFRTLRAIAIFEGAKGVIVLAAGLGLLSLAHRDLQEIAGHLVEHLHLNPASHYPGIFIEAAGRTSDARLMLLAVGAAAYATVRLVEAYGLWFARRWAEWFAAAAGAIYVPFEVYKLVHDGGWAPAAALAINLGIVGVMVYALVKRKNGVRYNLKSRT
jgi:uncharacterized membrane protein (DUF2068 family)